MKLKRIIVTFCEACLNGEGAECHVPGCAHCLHDVPNALDPALYEVQEEWDAQPEAQQ